MDAVEHDETCTRLVDWIVDGKLKQDALIYPLYIMSKHVSVYMYIYIYEKNIYLHYTKITATMIWHQMCYES